MSGLTAAWHLKRAGIDVTLIEADDQVGGCMRTEHREGFLLEKGPFNVIVRDPAFEELLGDLSERIEVITAAKAARRRYLYRRGRLMIVPTNPVSFAVSPLLSFGAKCRAVAGLWASRRAGEAECTIEEFAVRRLGKEVSDTLVSAVVAGILAGDISKLSLRACFPTLWEFDRRVRSPIGYGISRAFRWSKKPGRHHRRWRGLVSMDRGLGALADAMGETLGPDLVTGCRVKAIGMGDEGPTLSCDEGGEAARLFRCRRLVMALPAEEAGRLLVPVAPQASQIIGTIESASLVVINLAYRCEDVGHPMRGFGFLAPHNEPDFPLMGILWADSAFPHHGKPGHRLIRVFIGGTRTPEAISWSDDRLLATAAGPLSDLLNVSGDPVLIDVCRYPAAIPQYRLGHTEKIERLRALVADVPGLYLVGNYLEGVAINDCVRLGAGVAREIIRQGRFVSRPSLQPA